MSKHCWGFGAGHNGVVQERKSVANAGLRVRRLTGEDIKPAHWEAFYQGYINTTGTCACHSTSPAVCAVAKIACSN